MDLLSAIEGFGRGFSFTRSIHYPYRFAKDGPVWVLEDDPVRRDGRTTEFIVYRTAAMDAERVIADRSLGRRYGVCLVYGRDEKEAPLKAEWKALGYRTRHLETFMFAPLDRPPVFTCDYAIERVASLERAAAVADAAGARQNLPEYLGVDDAPIRLYCALDGDDPVGWVRSVRVDDYGWVSNMFVQVSHRRCGIGRALLSAMMSEDRRLGLHGSLLLASSQGAQLYPALGYETLGYLRVFTPLSKK